MARIVAFAIALLAATPAAAADITGEELFAMCRNQHEACGAYIRGALRKAGWAERVPFRYMLEEQKKLEWLICPTIRETPFLAKVYTQYWRPRPSELQKQWARQAVLTAFRADSTDHDCSPGTKT